MLLQGYQSIPRPFEGPRFIRTAYFFYRTNI